MSRKTNAKRPTKGAVPNSKRPASGDGSVTPKVGWFFASNEGGEDKGLNDAGVVTFKGNIYRYLAREIIQNSLDASGPPTDFCGVRVLPLWQFGPINDLRF